MGGGACALARASEPARGSAPRRSRARGSAVATLAVAALLLGANAPAHAADPFLRRTPTVAVVKSAGPAVVNITTEQLVTRPNPFRRRANTPFELFFRDFYADRSTEKVQNLGSGVIIDAQGHVLTNEHVIARATRIRVTLNDGREFDAIPVGADPNNDLAVLQIQTSEKLPWIEPGESADLFVGEPVIAIGNPFGLTNTVTTGVLSAVDRSFNAGDESYHGFLQTDASINPGNSGGPLLNAEGTLIGINSAIYQGAEGIGFAIPIDTAKRVVAELLEHGEIQPVWLGLAFQELDPALHEVMRLPEGLFGILLTDVEEDGPAGQAGLRRGDIMTRLDGRPLGSVKELFDMLEPVVTRQQLVFEVWRDAKLREFDVTAEEMPSRVYDQLAERFLGLKLRADPSGFEVVEVRRGSEAARIGIAPGDRILGINGRAVASESDLRHSLIDLRGRSRALVVVQRGGGRYHVTLRIT